MVPFGRSLPQIAAGVAQEDRAALCRQHYTSKLRTVDDLQRELAFGFRGEALHSMSEVAGEVRCEQTRLPGLGADARRQVTVLTKTEADEMGEQLVFNCSGELLSRAPRASATGTVVRVGRLFARTPVRRRMAAEKARKRAEDAETQRILVAYGLALPPLKLSLRSADAVPPRAWNKPAVESLDAAVSSCLGARVLVNNQRIAGSGTVRDAGSEQSDARGAEEEEGGEEEAVVTVEASLPRAGGDVGTVSRSRPTDLHFFLNSRPVHMPRLARAIRDVYSACCPHWPAGRWPVGALHLRLPQRCVDVNLSPDKRQVALTCEPGLVRYVEDLVRGALPQTDVRAALQWRESQPASTSSSLSQGPSTGESQRGGDEFPQDTPPGRQRRARKAAPRAQQKPASTPELSRWFSDGNRGTNDGGAIAAPCEPAHSHGDGPHGSPPPPPPQLRSRAPSAAVEGDTAVMPFSQSSGAGAPEGSGPHAAGSAREEPADRQRGLCALSGTAWGRGEGEAEGGGAGRGQQACTASQDEAALVALQLVPGSGGGAGRGEGQRDASPSAGPTPVHRDDGPRDGARTGQVGEEGLVRKRGSRSGSRVTVEPAPKRQRNGAPGRKAVAEGEEEEEEEEEQEERAFDGSGEGGPRRRMLRADWTAVEETGAGRVAEAPPGPEASSAPLELVGAVEEGAAESAGVGTGAPQLALLASPVQEGAEAGGAGTALIRLYITSTASVGELAHFFALLRTMMVPSNPLSVPYFLEDATLPGDDAAQVVEGVAPHVRLLAYSGFGVHARMRTDTGRLALEVLRTPRLASGPVFTHSDLVEAVQALFACVADGRRPEPQTCRPSRLVRYMMHEAARLAESRPLRLRTEVEQEDASRRLRLALQGLDLDTVLRWRGGDGCGLCPVADAAVGASVLEESPSCVG